jgi:S-methylmethionine-dependent homocysteine/selenocysteine methylase
MMDGPLSELLRTKRPVILDGATGTELQRRGVDTGLPLWSANALLFRPSEVLAIHLEYLIAGANIITANTFRTTRRTFRRAGIPDRSEELTRLALTLAEEACAAVPARHALIAGSIAPLEDCYRPELVPWEPDLYEEHQELAMRLASGGADFLLLETMNTVREAHAACRAAIETGLEVVVSFICGPDGNLYGGDSLGDAIRLLEPLGPTAFSINCVSPRFLTAAIANLRRATRLPFGVYGNVGLPDSETGWEFTWDVGPEEYALAAEGWAAAGAAIIGGCCGTTPDYIRLLNSRLTPP